MADLQIPTLAGVDRDQLLATVCRDSLRRFVREAWPLVEPGHQLIWGWHLDSICELLEAVSRGEILRLLMNVPPRHMKSLLTSVFWPAWEWLTEPQTRYLTVSHSGPLAIRDALRTRRLMQSEGIDLDPADLLVYNQGRPATLLQRIGYRGLLQQLGSTWEFSGDQNLKSSYENDRTGARIATSIGGGATGEGGDRVMIDDPHKLEEWDSEAKLKEAVEFVTGIAPNRINSKTGALVMIMQRVHEEDATAAVLGEVEDNEGWRDVVHLCLPEEYEPAHIFVTPPAICLPDHIDDGGDLVEGDVLQGDPRSEAGDLLWPQRFGPAEVADHKRQGALKYAGNYQQRPSPAEGNIFLRQNWRFYGEGGDRQGLPPTWQRVQCHWDLTFGETEDPGASWVVGQLWGQDGPDAYLLAMIRARMSFPDQKAAIPVLRDWSPLDQEEMPPGIYVEEKAAGKPLIEDLRTEVPNIHGRNPGKSKTSRAVAVQGLQEAGNVWLPRILIPAPAGYDSTPTNVFVDEAANFPAGSTDQVDVLSQALKEMFHTQTEDATSHAAGVDRGDPEVVAGGRIRKGERYVDKE